MRSKPVNCIPGITGRISIIPASLALVLTVLAICSVCIPAAGADTAGTTDDIMSDPSHSNKADPDYSVVFPGDRVSTMTITIHSANWEIMRANMTELYGEFGGNSNGGTPDQQGAPVAGQGADNPGRGQGMGNMFSNSDPVYVTADVTFEGLEWEHVGIRFKGFNSLQGSWNEGSYKISLKLNFDKFEDDYPKIKNQRFYGFDELNLQGAYNDDSLMRDMIVPSIFRESGVAAPQTAFYRLYVDYGEGPVYFGLYTMVESVEDTVIETQFEDDSGNLYKPEGNGATFAEGTFDTACFEKKTNEDDSDWSDVEELYTILNSDTRLSDPEQWRAELEAVFDVDIFLRWLATNTVIQNWDTYGGNCRNFYLYDDPTDGKLKWIPWDNNYALSSGMNPGNQAAAVPGNIPENRTPGMRNELSGTGTSLSLQTFPDTGNAPAVTGFTGNSKLVSFPIAQDNAAVPGDIAPGNRSPGDMNGGGGMGRTLSLSLDDAGDNWPLIRYLADDPVYYAKYQGYLEMVATTSFEPVAMEETYRYYHSLIAPYVTGPDGEQAGYTHLNNPEDFDVSLTDLISHAYDRYDAVMEFLSPALTPAPVPTTIPTATPTATPTHTPSAAPAQSMITSRNTATPVVSIITPARSGVATPGKALDIAWSATGTGDITGVTLEYSANGRTWTVITEGLPAEGVYSWTVPGLSGSLLMVKVTATDAAGNTGSASRVCLVSSQASGSSSLSDASTGQNTSAVSLKEGLLNTHRISQPSSLQDSRATALPAAQEGERISQGSSRADLINTFSVSQPVAMQDFRAAALSSAQARNADVFSE